MFFRVMILIAGTLQALLSVEAIALDRQELQTALNAVLDTSPTARRTTVALKVVDLQSGEVLYDRHGDRLMTPASNLKIYTAACALDTFGPAQRFVTQVSAQVDSQSDAIVGDLTLVGGGDAMLTRDDLEQLADRVVKEWGVRTLHGRVVVDNSRYSKVQLGPGWMWDDQPYGFNMRITPLMVDFNSQTLQGDKVSDDDDLQLFAVKDPTAWVSSMFAAMLQARGVTIKSTEASNVVAAKRLTLRHEGVSLAAALKHFLHASENAIGEVLLHEIALADGAKHPTWSDGAKRITHWLHETAGLEAGSFRLVDGSGLSRYNLISADSSVRLLTYMRGHKHYETFYKALSTYQVDVGNGKTQGLVHAKSGGMTSVSTISGYTQTLEGRQLAFSLLGNGYIGSNESMLALREKVWQVLVQYVHP